jgi:hypothetical protein
MLIDYTHFSARGTVLWSEQNRSRKVAKAQKLCLKFLAALRLRVRSHILRSVTLAPFSGKTPQGVPNAGVQLFRSGFPPSRE